MAVDVRTTTRPAAPSAPERSAWHNRQVLDRLHREHGGTLVAFLTSRAGDRELAQDLAQETFLRLGDHLDELDTDRPVWPWLKTVAANLIVDHRRKHRREHLTDDLTLHHQPDGHDPIEIALERDLLGHALDQLTERQRLAIELRYLEQWKAAEACEMFGLTRTAFEQLLFRARTNLRDAYQALTDQPARLAGLLLAPLARLKTSLTTRARARIAGWDQTLQSMGPALDAIGQAAATIALLGLATTALATGGSPASADITVERFTTAYTLTPFFEAPRSSTSTEVQGPPTSTSAPGVATNPTVQVTTSSTGGLDTVGTQAEGQITKEDYAAKGDVQVDTPMGSVWVRGPLVDAGCNDPVMRGACDTLPSSEPTALP